MQEMDGAPKPPQISEMFQKFAIAFKAKTFEFFAEDEDSATAATTPAAFTDTEDGADGFSLLDSAEEFITDQKVVVLKPDPAQVDSVPNSSRPLNAEFIETLISSIFAAVSCFEASYLQLQTAHVPFDEKAIVLADRALVSHLQRLSDIRKLYRDFRRNPVSNSNITIESRLEAQVQENQSKLRALETMVNQLQSDIDDKDDEVLTLKKKLDCIQQSNSKLSKRLSKNSKLNSGTEILLTIWVFDSLLRDACRGLHCFTKLLVSLMKKAGWDLDSAANSVHSDIQYLNRGHNRYAFLSYVSLVMFRGFDLEDFGLICDEIVCNGNGNGSNLGKKSYLKHIIDHVSSNPMEVLSRNPHCDFSRFCEKKYEQLVHPTMESSIFRNLDKKEAVLDSWKSLGEFYESFVKMGSSVWLLHKLAYLFDPPVEIFQVERGVDFSAIYMEDVTMRGLLQGKSKPKVGFTAVPGFKIGKTVIQSKVYLTNMV